MFISRISQSVKYEGAKVFIQAKLIVNHLRDFFSIFESLFRLSKRLLLRDTLSLQLHVEKLNILKKFFFVTHFRK